MPCYSSVIKTKMLDASILIQALGALGEEVTSQSELSIWTKSGLHYYRSNRQEGFSVTDQSGSQVEKDRTQSLTSSIGMKYAELTARSWAKARGYSVTSFDAEKQKMKLVNRRG